MDYDYIRSTKRRPPSVGEAKAHVILDEDARIHEAYTLCGRVYDQEEVEQANRLPTTWRLCGTCARSMAASEDEG